MFKALFALSLIFAACSTAPAVTETETTGSPANSQAVAITAPDPTTVPVLVLEPDLLDNNLTDNAAIFVASLEETVIDTVFAGAILDSPGVFIAAGEIVCTRLDAGDSVDDILNDYLTGLVEADHELTEEDVIVLAGGVMGASVQLFCPQHIELIEEQP